MSTIGFLPFYRDWQGPVCLEFVFDSMKTKTARYTAVENRQFALYAPLFMLEGLAPGEVPQKLLALIGKGPESIKIIGFSQTDFRPRVDSEVCEYEFMEAKVNSLRYDFVHAGQTYALYVPKVIFGAEPPPKSGYIRNSQRVKRCSDHAWPCALGFSYCTKFHWDLRRNIHISDRKEDHIGEGMQSTKSAGSVFDDFDDSIEALGYCVSQPSV